MELKRAEKEVPELIDYSLIIVAVLIVIAAYLVFRLTEHLVKALGFVVLLVIGVLVYSAYFVGADISDVKSNFFESGKAVLLESDKPLAGFVAIDLQKSPSGLSDRQLSAISNAVQEKDIDALESMGIYKVILISESVIPKNSVVEIQNVSFTTGDLLRVLKSSSPRQEFVALAGAGNIQAVASVIVSSFPEDAEFKSFIWYNMANHIVLREPLTSVIAYKNGQLKIFPETAVFKVARITPVNILKSVIEDLERKLKVQGLDSGMMK